MKHSITGCTRSPVVACWVMQVAITPTGPLTSKIEIDGQDISGSVTRVTLDMEAREVPKMYLELNALERAPILLDEAIVHVVTPAAEVNVGEVVLAWLDNIDAAVLDRLVLDEGDLTQPPGEGFLAALTTLAKNWAHG